MDNVLQDHPDDGRVHGGELSFLVPKGWDAGGSWSRVLTDQSGAFRVFEDGWGSFLTVGVAPKEQGFVDPAATAVQVFECHVSSGRFSGYTGSAIETSEAITVDGQTAWWVRGSATSASLPGGSATYDVVVIDRGNPAGLAVYWAGVVDADAQALADLDLVRSGLKLSD